MTRAAAKTTSTTSAAYAAALARLLAAPTLPKLGLSRMRALLAQLGDPQLRYPVLHIAGTKGKGSTAAITASILRAAGLRVGLTTSPHLLSARERIVVDGGLVSAAAFVDVEARVAAAAHTLAPELEVPSFFERLCAMAFLHFADVAVDVAVVEVGLGGRLDATNVVVPRACAITRLGMDHMEYLGPTLRHIAAEKAGIIKAGVPVVTAVQDVDAADVVAAVAAERGAPLVVAPPRPDVALGLVGAHQAENAGVALALVDAAGFDVDAAAVAAGCAGVRWPGRFERVAPHVILDGAHNIDSARALAATLAAQCAGQPLHLVIGMSRGHDPAEFVEVLAPRAQSLVATAAQHPRAIAANDIAHAACVFGVVDVVPAVSDAVAVAAARAARDGGVVVVCGSLFVVGEARAAFVEMPTDPALPTY